MYLHAAVSLKDGVADALTPDRAAAVADWRATILAVAREEMVHLLPVPNLITAPGGTAHFGRMTVPIPPGSCPADMQVRLDPFDRDTLEHVIWLEQPPGSGGVQGVRPRRCGGAATKAFRNGTHARIGSGPDDRHQNGLTAPKNAVAAMPIQ